MSKEVENRIKEALKNKANRLDLSKCELTEIPQSVVALTNLEELNLNRNPDLNNLSDLAQFHNLTALVVYNTQVSDLKPLAQLLNLTRLYVSNTQVSDLSPLAQLINLTRLYVSDTQVSDLTPLAQLYNLTELNVSNSQICDLSPLTQLNNLAELNVSNTQFYDSSPLAQLYNLTRLNFYNTQMSDLNPLAQLLNLTQLYVSNTPVSDLSPLAQLLNLTRLYVSDTQVSDLSPLAQLHNLTELGVSNTQVSDLSPLAQLHNLTELKASNTHTSDLSPLTQLHNLTELNVCNTKISDLSSLTQLFNLAKLDISNTRVKDLSLLIQLQNLTELNIAQLQISDLSPLTQLHNLTRLSVANTRVSDLTPLAQLHNLTEVNVSNIQFSDLSPLAQLHNLTTIVVYNTQVSDLSPLAQLHNLNKLDIFNTPVSDLSLLIQLHNLTTLNISNTQVSDLSPLTQLHNLNTLNISNTQVSDLSPLTQLHNLNTLSISNTQVSDLSPLTQLHNLNTLNISNTQVSDLSPLTQLHNLNTLNISNTQVSDLSPLTQLHNLTMLYVSNTQVSDLNPLIQMHNLTRLSVANTRVRDLSPLAQLHNLTEVNVSNTQVSDLTSLKLIINKGTFVKNQKGSGNGIFVKGCQLNTPPLEIIEQGNESILRYWKQIETQQGTVELYEGKLIIVGEGGTGKTTLFEKLKDQSHQLGSTPETHGINIHEGLPFQHPEIGDNTFYANLWDFGGQQLQYMTHQFFLTPRALYVLMMDARRESPNLAYWFKIISLLGRESEDAKEKVKLLLIFNKYANSTGQPQYQDILKFYEDSIEAHYLEVDFGVNDFRFEHLQKAIQSHLVALPIVKSQLPRLWKDVREYLRTEAKKENYISTRRFSEICSQYNINQEADQWLLSGYLHQLGSLLHFQNDRGLRSWIILNPQWAVDGVYSFLTNEKIVNNYGHFQESEFIKLLAGKGYSQDEADLILQIMTKNNFDICYEASAGRYVAAQLLPDLAPEYSWYPKDVLQFRYQYSIMPKGLMSRLIVRLSDNLDRNPETDKQIVWKKGGVFRLKLSEGECRVRLREDDAESKSGLRQILIDVIGDAQARRYALHKIRDAVEDLHKKWFRSLKADEMVPCCCSECEVSDNPQLFKLENLLKRSTKRKDTSCDTSGEDILIQTLLEGIYEQQEIYSMKRER